LDINNIYEGDCLEVLKTFPDESVDMCITSPPYWNLRDYGTAEWTGGDETCDHIKTKNLKRDTSGGFTGRDKGTRGEQSNTSSSVIQYRDECKKCGAKSIDKQLGLESTPDKFVDNLCDVFDEVQRVLQPHGTCWVNLGDTYISGKSRYSSSPHTINKVSKDEPMGGKKVDLRNHPIYKDKSLAMIPNRFAIEMVNRGWILRNELIWHKPNCMPESVKDRFTNDYEKLLFFTKNPRYYFKQQLEPVKDSSIERMKYKMSPKAKLGLKGTGFKDNAVKLEGRNKRAVWVIKPSQYKEAHFATFPEKLIESPIDAGCKVGGIVLDPFFGSGTTGVVALRQDKNYIGIEVNHKYIKLAKERLTRPMIERKTREKSKDFFEFE
tara:strand:+ start:3455 stop:4591 length:1137 start_codon:yes stop_codon:yes gene_type:complete